MHLTGCDVDTGGGWFQGKRCPVQLTVSSPLLFEGKSKSWGTMGICEKLGKFKQFNLVWKRVKRLPPPWLNRRPSEGYPVCDPVGGGSLTIRPWIANPKERQWTLWVGNPGVVLGQIFCFDSEGVPKKYHLSRRKTFAPKIVQEQTMKDGRSFRKLRSVQIFPGWLECKTKMSCGSKLSVARCNAYFFSSKNQSVRAETCGRNKHVSRGQRAVFSSFFAKRRYFSSKEMERCESWDRGSKK